MKTSLQSFVIKSENPSNLVHKSLIPVGAVPKPFLYYLVRKAFSAGYSKLYLITGKENQAFQELESKGIFPEGMQICYAVQPIPKGRTKPLGTADALQECMEQFPELKEQMFTVCNGDNLYSEGALRDLRTHRDSPNALISYASSGLKFNAERVAKFAVMTISEHNFLKEIVEKPDLQNLSQYRDVSGELRVSMNIFSFSGEMIYPFLKSCPLDKARNEKELTKAVSNMIRAHPKSMLCMPRSEHIPDLTDAWDIPSFKKLL
ncbi:sugar phosphate nucleotidyltransferase [Flagellimonas allohymeniacidonis]|nr:sugar phosphate nucleotidyltransferase [Allomuricauda hymeniacidonis]